nr:hypothetical protein [Alphaproteobacteria bacterium]
FCFPVPFKVVFRHASASRSKAENIIVKIRSDTGLAGFGEGCPRDYVTGETIQTAVRFIEQHKASLTRDVTTVAALRAWVDAHQPEIDKNPAAFCAVELAILDLLGKTAGAPVEAIIGVPQMAATFDYSAILGDAPYAVYWWQFQRYWHAGFRDFKVKISGKTGRDQRKIGIFRRRTDPLLRVRLDANNLWSTAEHCIAHINRLSYPVFAIEEPLRANDIAGFRSVAVECKTRIILDESFLRREQLDVLTDPDKWLINVRVSKMGGLLRAIDIVNGATRRGIGVIVGAQVGETSILTRAALIVATTAGDRLAAQEGAFGTRLLQEDLTIPSLMFGDGGTLVPLRIMDSEAPGLGLEIKEGLLSRPAL